MSRWTFARVTATIAPLMLGCGSLTFPDVDPTIRGDIVAIGETNPFGGARSIWVKEMPESPCGIVFRTDEDTRIGEMAPNGDVEPRRFEDLIVGHTLRVWSGAVAESCPGQALAEIIEIIPRLESG